MQIYESILSEKKYQIHSLELKNDQPIMRYVGSQWLDELKPIRKKSTWVKYDNQLNSHIFPVLGDKQINEISNEDLISFVNGLLTGDNIFPSQST